MISLGWAAFLAPSKSASPVIINEHPRVQAPSAAISDSGNGSVSIMTLSPGLTPNDKNQFAACCAIL